MRGVLISLWFLVLMSAACTFTRAINDGKSAYDAKQYAIAVELLENEFLESDSNADKGHKAFLIGKSYQFMNDHRGALKWFQIAADKDYGSKAYLNLGFALKQNQQYPAAIKAFEEVNRLQGNRPEVTREINICRQASNWVKPNEELDIAVYDFGSNTDFSDYSPALYENDFVVFSSDREGGVGNEVYNWTGANFSDLYIVNKNGGAVQLFGSNFNTVHNEATIAFNQDQTEVFFTRCYAATEDLDDYCKILYSRFEDNFWTNPEALEFQEELRNYGHPALIENDSVLVFTVKMDDGSETYDLFYSFRSEEGWTLAEPMPTSINTDGNEKFPTSDGDTIYFSSDFLPGLGGLDIFKTYLRSNGSWAPPINLKAPFNSGTDDFGLVVDRTLKYSKDILQKGFFTSSRNYESNDDVYGYEIRRKEKPLEEEVEEVAEEKDFKVFLACRVVYNVYSIPDNPTSKLIDKVVLDGAKVNIDIGGKKLSFTTDKDGRFIEEVPVDIDMLLTASKSGYLNNVAKSSSKKITPDNDETSVTINVEIALDKLITDKEIVLENIYYDYAKWDIRSDAKPSLNKLAQILKNNPKLVIELSSHTDCRGNKSYNQNLSQKRAQSAVNYIISTGIPSRQMIPKGFGKELPAIACECDACTEDEHQTNRRTSFKILSYK